MAMSNGEGNVHGYSVNETSATMSGGVRSTSLTLDDSGALLRKHFMQLDGLGVRDLHFSGDDLYILAGPTMVLDGDIRVFKWAGAKPVLAANREPARFETGLTVSATLPHGRGVNRAEALCDLPPALLPGQPSWPVLYDAPGADRKDGEYTVFGDVLHHVSDASAVSVAAQTAPVQRH